MNPTQGGGGSTLPPSLTQDEEQEQHSFQALKNRWAQQALKQEPPLQQQQQQQQQQNIARAVSPPPIPPKPISVSSTQKPQTEVEEKTSSTAAKRVSLLTQQFEKQKFDVVTPSSQQQQQQITTGNFSNSSSTSSLNIDKPQLPLEKPPRVINKKAPAPPPPSTVTAAAPVIISQSPPVLSDVEGGGPFSEDDDESSDGESDIDEEEEDIKKSSGDGSVKEGDNSLIEQVQKAHLQYTKLEESRFIGRGAPGVRPFSVTAEDSANKKATASSSSTATSSPILSNSNKIQKKAPPPPPPSKKYHRSTAATAATPNTTTTQQAQSTTSIPMTKDNTRPEFNPQPSIVVDTTPLMTSPPTLPPRPPPVNNNNVASPMMPQLPPRPSQSTLARAHTIASGGHGKTNNSTITALPASIYSATTLADSPSLNNNSDFEDSSSNTTTTNSSNIRRSNTTVTTNNNKRAMSRSELLMTTSIYPDFSQATRNAPHILMDHRPFSTGHKGNIYALAACKNLIITGSSNQLKTWDVYSGTVMIQIQIDHQGNSSSSGGGGSNNLNMNQTNNSNNNDSGGGERIRSIVTAPSVLPIDEGRYIWVARQDTMLAIVDTRAGGSSYKVISKRSDVHMSPVLFLLRYGNSEIWSIDDGGVLNVWDVLAGGTDNTSITTITPKRYHVTSHAVAATIYGSKLWMSSGRTLACHTIPIASFGGHGSTPNSFNNDAKSQQLPPVRIPNDMGNITKLMTIPYHPYRIFASHDDGKISMWDTRTMERMQVITVSMYGICTMACVGEYHVWAGYNTGMIYVYDTRPEKWRVLKMWKAHTGAVTQLVVDQSSLLLDEIKGRLQVVSSDSNGFVGVWDGLLTEHWKEDHLHQRASEYCTYDDAKVMICSWNIDANKPEKIVGEDDKQVREWLGTMEDPDVIVVGIQEIVDLESKKQTARSLFFKKKVDPTTEAEDVLTHRYKLWRDYLVRIVGENYGYHNYTVIKTDQLVGLFSCIFVRTTDIDRVFNVDSTSVKTGLKVMNKSIHGNKGGIAIRFVYDHSSFCFVNCHLAAGQSHVQQRNADAEGILQSASFPKHDYADVFSHGGDGGMIMDHEFCFLSGDLNYRIKMTRSDVLKLLTSPDKAASWDKLQSQDQLLKQHINNPLFKLLHFEEAPIRFDPTYKYDPGTDFYDRSEKKRVPAWCDRVLYKGQNIKNLYYRRYEARCSDHRPIGAGFSFKTKVTDQKKRDALSSKIEEEWKSHIDRFIKDKKARYVADYERCSLNEAFSLLEKSDWDVNDTVIKLFNTL